MTAAIMLIHGAWLTPSSLNFFRFHYEAQGHVVVVPPWPLQDRSIADLRRSPHPELSRLTIGKIVDHYDALIRALPEAPILIGHSLGGLVVQMLLDRGLGAAGVAISPAPARGILPTPRALWAALPNLLAWWGWRRVLYLSESRFGSDFANTLNASEQSAAFAREVVPTPGRLYYQLALGLGSGVRFTNPDRAPLLLIAGEEDRTVEASMVLATYAKYQRAQSVTAYESFPGRSHLLIASPGWEEIADHAINWATEQARAGAFGQAAAPISQPIEA